MCIGRLLICSCIKGGRSIQKWVPAMFVVLVVGGDNGDYDDVAASVIVCVRELIAGMQAAAWGQG